MPPKRPSRRQGFRRDAIKRPRSNADASTKKDDSARLKNTPGRELYSPNINSSEFSDLTEDGDEELADPPKSTSIEGKTPRQIRAARRAAERRFDDLTDSDEEPGESVKAGSQGPPEGVDLISKAGAKGQAVEEQLPSHAEAESENSPEKGPGLDLIGDDEVVEEEPAENIEAEAEESPEEVESDPNADAEGDDVQAAMAVANDEVESQEPTEETPLDPNVDAEEDDNEEPSANEEEEDQAT
ncbi:hypothetical protein NUW58_g8759 [Xylaria curta]|uniref:Uncharacterized protein n=1 Tax=Xylaria curta TaxID=42375 RepID=A0ACC1N553_9PEZI|nr:hypothetical protein NUW58_g8759 [Xylaria curta]